MKFLLREGNAGYRTVDGEPLDAKRQPFRPWMLTTGGDVVYAEWKDRVPAAPNSLLKPYDKLVSQSRRRQFDTLLARDAQAYPEYSREAVSMVSQNLIRFVEDRMDPLHALMRPLGKVIRDRCFSNTGSGRLGTTRDGQISDDEEVWEDVLLVLNSANDIPKILNIQNALTNVLTRNSHFALDKSRKEIYMATAARVTPTEGYLHSWFKPGNSEEDKTEDGLRRGRAKADGRSVPSSLPGVMSAGDADGGSQAEARIRGIDTWTPKAGTGFVNALELRNLVFGAGRSGTTGELLKVYRTFGRMDCDEQFKQYLFAILAYLVGGGHHSCHEVFNVANLLVGVNGPRNGRVAASVADLVRGAYVPGKYIKHLPDSYLKSPHFEKLKEKFYDIAVLGHLHGTFA